MNRTNTKDSSKAVKKNQSVDRVFQIIETLADGKGSMRLQDIAQKIGIPASTVIRFMYTLMEHGYAMQEADSLKYRLTMKLAHIGNRISSQFSVRETARPFLEELTEQCGESACLAIEQGSMAVYIDVEEGPDNTLRALQRIGKAAPLHSTGVGKILLSGMEPGELDALLREELAPLTTNTITDREKLKAEVQSVREKGFAVDDEECEVGVRCIAAPVRDYTGRIIASISVSGPVTRMNSQKMTHVETALRETADSISRVMGWEPEK